MTAPHDIPVSALPLPGRIVPKSGVILADKPAGITSQALVNRFRRILGIRAVGHTGTLDPVATGLNVLCYGRATRAAAYLLEGNKAYIASLRFGLATDTGDMTGAVTETGRAHVDPAALDALLASFHGTQLQTPPAYSAIKQNGVRLYALARTGVSVDPPPRTITIYAIQRLSSDTESGVFSFFVRCSKGTYIRSLCRDLGKALGTCAVMTALRRVESGHFSVEHAYTPEQAAAMAAAGDGSFALPADAVFPDAPRITLHPHGVQRLRDGAVLSLSDVAEAPCRTAGLLRVYTQDGTFLAVGRFTEAGLDVEKRFFEID